MNRSHLACLALVACVPSTDTVAPAGAAGFTLDLSPATQGEPFDTADGYRITIDQLVFNGLVSARSTTPNQDGSYEGNSDATLLSITSSEPFFTTAIPEGEAQVSFDYSNGSVGNRFGDRPLIQAAAQAYLARFERRADLDHYMGYGPRSTARDIPFGPSVLIVFHAERNGARWDANLTLEGTTSGFAAPPKVRIRRNELVTTPLHVAAEALFRQSRPLGDSSADAGPEVELLFAPFADADAEGDGDGQLTAQELFEHRDARQRPLSDELILRTMGIFTLP